MLRICSDLINLVACIRSAVGTTATVTSCAFMRLCVYGGGLFSATAFVGLNRIFSFFLTIKSFRSIPPIPSSDSRSRSRSRSRIIYYNTRVTEKPRPRSRSRSRIIDHNTRVTEKPRARAPAFDLRARTITPFPLSTKKAAMKRCDGYARPESGYARPESGYARLESGYARPESGYSEIQRAVNNSRT
jgi:hypothetical protein